VSTPWIPEREVTVVEARECVLGCGLTADDVRVVAAGWDNTVVLVDDTWVFRFPRREMALPGVDREIAVLPHLAPTLSLPIPVPEHVGVYGDPPWSFWGARHLPGTELAVSPHADRGAVAAVIGRFLAELHALPADPDLPIDPFGRADAATRAGHARDALADLKAVGIDRETGPVDDVLTAGEAAGPPPTDTVLSHGDLYSRHVLVDGDGHAAGVIDWGDLCVAPASVDLSIAYSAFTDAAREAFFAEYGAIDADTELRARVMAVFSAASVAHYAHDKDHPALLDAALAELERAAS
jgi:aminoglycoside phosphotransferase (APT) family kinase protein